MKKIIRYSLIITTILLLVSCSSSKKSKKVHIPYVNYSEEMVPDDETINVPYTLEWGVKYVQVKIN